jgi:transcriptional regulator NrdR family protein
MAVFTTRESIETEYSFRVVYDDGSMSPLSRDRLFLSIYGSLEHRTDAVEEATALTTAVLRKLVDKHSLKVPVRDLVDTTHSSLRRFNTASASIYAARYRY